MVREAERVVWMRRRCGADDLLVALHPAPDPVRAEAPLGRWRRLLDSADARWGGPGAPAALRTEETQGIALAPWSCSVFEAEVRGDRVAP